MNIAVTGGFGCGKSTVAKMLAARLSASYVDADQLARKQLRKGFPGYDHFVHEFGRKYLLDTGEIDRDRLRGDVFHDGSFRQRLESVLHPLVGHELQGRMESSQDAFSILVAEIPLLYEVGWEDQFDLVTAVSVPESIMVKRVVKRSGLTEGEILEVSKAQMPVGLKMTRADFGVDNSGLLAASAQQVGWIAARIKAGQRIG